MDTQTIAADRFIREQHDLIRELFRGIADAPPDGRRAAFEPLVRLLAVHETAEELVIYPMLEREDDDAQRIVAERKREEDAAKRTLSELEDLDPSEAGFLPRLTSFQHEVEAHAEAEEREILPLLARITNKDELESIGRRLQRAEAMAPTHAHPHAPESAIGNMLVGPFVGMLDRVRDAINDAGG